MSDIEKRLAALEEKLNGAAGLLTLGQAFEAMVNMATAITALQKESAAGKAQAHDFDERVKWLEKRIAEMDGWHPREQRDRERADERVRQAAADQPVYTERDVYAGRCVDDVALEAMKKLYHEPQPVYAKPVEMPKAPVIFRMTPTVEDGVLKMRSFIDEAALKQAASEDEGIRKVLMDLGWIPPKPKPVDQP